MVRNHDDTYLRNIGREERQSHNPNTAAVTTNTRTHTVDTKLPRIYLNTATTAAATVVVIVMLLALGTAGTAAAVVSVASSTTHSISSPLSPLSVVSTSTSVSAPATAVPAAVTAPPRRGIDPYPYLFGGSFGPEIPSSPDPLASYTWDDSKLDSSGTLPVDYQCYHDGALNATAVPLDAVDNIKALLGPQIGPNYRHFSNNKGSSSSSNSSSREATDSPTQH